MFTYSISLLSSFFFLQDSQLRLGVILESLWQLSLSAETGIWVTHPTFSEELPKQIENKLWIFNENIEKKRKTWLKK